MNQPFYIGDKVVCVDDSPAKDGRPLGLEKGKIYCVEFTRESMVLPGCWHVVIVGLPKYFTRRGLINGYRHERFRLINRITREIEATAEAL